jgi:hypothetical protein
MVELANLICFATKKGSINTNKTLFEKKQKILNKMINKGFVN